MSATGCSNLACDYHLGGSDEKPLLVVHDTGMRTLCCAACTDKLPRGCAAYEIGAKRLSNPVSRQTFSNQ